MLRSFRRVGCARGPSTTEFQPTISPTFSTDGAGIDGTGTLAVAYPAGATAAGACLLLHVHVRTSSGQAPNTPTDWVLLAGPHSSPTPTSRQWVFGKLASGSESGTLSVTFAAGTSRKTARMYRVHDVSSLSVEGVTTTNGILAAIPMPTVPVGGVHRLVVAFVGVDDDNTISAATGATGGTWVEPVAEYLGSAGTSMVQLQTAALASGGSISGGTSTMSGDDDSIVTAFALVGV